MAICQLFYGKFSLRLWHILQMLFWVVSIAKFRCYLTDCSKNVFGEQGHFRRIANDALTPHVYFVLMFDPFVEMMFAFIKFIQPHIDGHGSVDALAVTKHATRAACTILMNEMGRKTIKSTRPVRIENLLIRCDSKNRLCDFKSNLCECAKMSTKCSTIDEEITDLPSILGVFVLSMMNSTSEISVGAGHVASLVW